MYEINAYTPRRTFCVGDIHGHLDRLEALLKAEGIIGRCPACDGTGTFPGESISDLEECQICDGNGIARIDHDTLVVQLGDLGHFGVTGSPTGDLLCWRAVHKAHWCDVVLWGNHDRALVDSAHTFRGYFVGNRDVNHHVQSMQLEGRLQLAFAAHGHLLTHAGLHDSFKHQNVPNDIKTNVEDFVDWINDEDEIHLDGEFCNGDAIAIRDAIGARRGGSSDAGGILWRDASEKLFPNWPQVFGHSAGDLIRTFNNDSYCIDIGSTTNGCLAGMWLPSREFVQIDTTQPNNGIQRFPA